MKNKLRLYEFSSKVKCYSDDICTKLMFIEYDVGKFMLNSFEKETRISKTTRGIPQAIDSAIRQDYFRVNTLSSGRIALTGRYLEDDWVVLAVSDQLAGRPNEVYRYFCVQSLTEEVDPMLSLIDWYLLEKPRFNPDPKRNFQTREIPASSPKHQGEKSKFQELILNVLQKTKNGGQETIFENSSLELEELREIIANLPLEERKSFTWALNAANPISLIRSKNFRLVEYFKLNQGELQKYVCIVPPRLASLPVEIIPSLGGREEQIQLIKNNLKNIPKKPSEILSIIKIFFEQNLEQNVVQSIFDDREIADLIYNNSSDNKGLILLILQAVLLPNRVSNLAEFIYECSSCPNRIDAQKQINNIDNWERQLRRDLEKQLENLIKNQKDISQEFYIFMDKLYEGVWLCLNQISDKKYQQFLARQKQKQGLWDYILTNQVRIDFYNYLFNSKNPTDAVQKVQRFFENFKCLDETKRELVLNVWEGDEIFNLLRKQQVVISGCLSDRASEILNEMREQGIGQGLGDRFS